MNIFFTSYMLLCNIVKNTDKLVSEKFELLTHEFLETNIFQFKNKI